MIPGPARDELICSNLPLARGAAVGISRRYRIPLTEDLIGTATEGLVDAATRWEPDTGRPFPPYAQVRIRGHVIDRLRAEAWFRGTSRYPERRVDPFSLEGGVLPGEPAGADEPEQLLEDGWEAEAVRQVVEQVAGVDRLVIELYFWQDRNQYEIAAALGVHQSAVCTRLKRVTKRLRAELEAVL